MDVVELTFPAAITVPKLMGSDNCGGVGVTVKEVEARLSDRVTLLVTPKMDSGGSLPGQKEAASWNRMADSEVNEGVTKLSSFHVEDLSMDPNIGSTSNTFMLGSGPEAKQHQRKSVKVTKSNNGGSKRSRMTRLEVCVDATEANDVKGISKEVDLSPATCSLTDKTQTSKHKTNLNGKRGDKRNSKGPKGKCEFFSVKGGLASFSSAAGGNNILGVYGSRPDIEDVTKHVEDLTLNELLIGNCNLPSFVKDKGKKLANSDANVLQTVREACSILQRKPIRPQTMEIDSGYYRDIIPYLVTSGSSIASRSDCNDGDTNMEDLYSGHKVLDFPLYQPKDVLQRLALPAPKDLDFLLIDATKPVASRNNADMRLGKYVSHRGGLPPFSWSNTFAGHCKSNSDATKLSTSKSTCQGRWVKIADPITSVGATSSFVAELQSLTYDNSLVPSEYQKLLPSINQQDPPTSASFTSFEQSLSSASAASPANPQVTTGGHSPRRVAAAQTLCDMATHCLKQTPHGMIKWNKKPSQKSMRAQNLKPNEKSEKQFAAPKSKLRPDSTVDTTEEALPSKKLRPSENDESAVLLRINSTTKGPMHWSMPRSSRSSPSKSFQEEKNKINLKIVKKTCMLPPAARISETAACSGQPKPRKLMRVEWNSREGGKLQ